MAKSSSQLQAEHQVDYVETAKAYARNAIRDKASHGIYIRQAAKRFLRDLRRAEDPDCAFCFDPWHASDPCDFIEKLPHVEGVWDPPTIELHPAQIFFLVQLFGFRMRSTGARRFSSAMYATARKNAKSTLSAGIMLYCFCCEDEPGAQLISAASTYDQACKVFAPAKTMVQKTQDLRDYFGIDVWAKSLTRFETGASFKPIHAKASTQDGLNPSHVALDEIHAHKTPDLVNVLTSAAGTRKNPLWLYTTTEGYINAGPWADLRQMTKNILNRSLGDNADHMLVCFWAIDPDDDEFDESCWIKANPLIDSIPELYEAIRKEAIDAKAMPSKMSEFRIKRLNRPSQVADGHIDIPKWTKCSGPVDLEMLKDVPCWGGLDLASTTDLCAFRMIWPVDDLVYTYGWRWAPQDAVAYRTQRGSVNYSKWVEEGLIKSIPGDVVDHDVVKQDILDLYKKFNIQEIAFDPWNAQDLVKWLDDKGVPMVKFIQGAQSYHPAVQKLDMLYRSGKLVHGGDEVLMWCASNLTVRTNVNLSMMPDKKNSADKIDDIVALYMPIGISIADDSNDIAGFINNPVIG